MMLLLLYISIPLRQAGWPPRYVALVLPGEVFHSHHFSLFLLRLLVVDLHALSSCCSRCSRKLRNCLKKTFSEGELRTPKLHFGAWACFLVVRDDQGTRKSSAKMAASVVVKKKKVDFWFCFVSIWIWIHFLFLTVFWKREENLERRYWGNGIYFLFL